MGQPIVRGHESPVRSPLLGSSEGDDRFPIIQQSKKQIEEIRARREYIGDYACREFGIERPAKAFFGGNQTGKKPLPKRGQIET